MAARQQISAADRLPVHGKLLQGRETTVSVSRKTCFQKSWAVCSFNESGVRRILLAFNGSPGKRCKDRWTPRPAELQLPVSPQTQGIGWSRITKTLKDKIREMEIWNVLSASCSERCYFWDLSVSMTAPFNIMCPVLLSRVVTVQLCNMTSQMYLNLITVVLVATEQHNDCTNCHSHHYTYHSLVFNDNWVPEYCVGVHQIIYLIFIWNTFPPSAI